MRVALGCRLQIMRSEWTLQIGGQALDWGLAIRSVPLSEEQQHRCGSRWPCQRARLHDLGPGSCALPSCCCRTAACLGCMVEQGQRVAVVLQAHRAEEEQGREATLGTGHALPLAAPCLPAVAHEQLREATVCVSMHCSIVCLAWQQLTHSRTSTRLGSGIGTSGCGASAAPGSTRCRGELGCAPSLGELGCCMVFGQAPAVSGGSAGRSRREPWVAGRGRRR